MLNKVIAFSNNSYSFKKFNIPLNLKLEFFCFKNSKFFFISKTDSLKKIYLFLPSFLNFYYIKNTIYFFFISKVNFKILFNFFYNFKYFLKNLNYNIFKTIYVRGNNYKINFTDNLNNSLKLKLGYSQLIYLNLPYYISIKLFKKKVVIKSYSKALIGNFSHLLYSYRPINIFTGKGLLIKIRKKFKLKEYSKKI